MIHARGPSRCSPAGRPARRILAPGALLALAVFLFNLPMRAQAPAISVTLGANGRLAYSADAAGNRIIDFSHAGYGGGGVALPDVPTRIIVGPGGGRDRQRIQAALDVVSAMPLDASGFRGTVLLERGAYTIDTDLQLRAGGVVLRGSGVGEDGTVLVAAGTSRRSLITMAGRGDRQEEPGARCVIADPYVPAGATSFTVDDAAIFSVGNRIVVRRPSTQEWIAALGMNLFQGWRPENRLHWQPGSRDIDWDRVVTAIQGNRFTIDAPLTTALDRQFGGGLVFRYAYPGRISRVGVEHLRIVSAYEESRPMDEDHAWVGITLDKVEHAWVRQVTAAHFASSVINVLSDARAVTIEDVGALDPVSETGGFRRRVFYTAGQLTLFRRCRSERGLHDFVAGFAAAGPNAFLESTARDALDYSGPLESWASGILYDNVIIRGNALRFTNRGIADQGAGWAAANSVLWNSEATDIEVQSPPGATNQAYGCKGLVTGDGIVWDPRTMPYRDFYRGTPVEPRSLYLAQLAERLGPAAVDAIQPRPVSLQPVSKPVFSATDGPPTQVLKPSLLPAGARRLSDEDVAAFVAREESPGSSAPRLPLRVENGVFTIDGQRAWTARTGYSWFQAQMPRSLAPSFGPALTRFAPGRTGLGATDDLEEVAAGMAPRSAFYQHYGLWYDRRRVDHNYYGSPEQRTGDAWAPFMELPWARSGQGKAWDGLTRYDLTRFNSWYFERVKGFADICDRKGLILYHNFYFQHWLLESRSHYVDFPWRPVNTIQLTGLPDEVPAANVFYDVTHLLRRELHRLYIRHALDVLQDNSNVVHGIDREYTGPIEFVQFWLDTIAEWQKEHGRTLYVSLEIPKAQMDAVLEDSTRGSMISAIDMLGWTYRADGQLFAARGGINRAPREQRPDIATPAELDALKAKLGVAATDQRDFLNGPEFQKLFDQLWASSKPMKYRAWREYRDRFPKLVLLWNGDEYPAVTHAVEAAIPAAVRAKMRPADVVRTHLDTSWCVARPGDAYIVYAMNGDSIEMDLTRDRASFAVSWLDASTGALQKVTELVTGGRVVTLAPPSGGAGRPWVAWLTRVR